jgi:eukaryotic-like serine/threonine-protein kinase
MAGDDRYTRAKRVFLVASGLPTGERTRFLNAQCADDPAMEAMVRQLLNADERDATFLETPALRIPSAGLPQGTHLGGFRIERLLGEGGMGIVYEALEDETSRRVALKVIRPGILSPRLRSRFRHEIRILGQLRHPGIAQIYEAGTLELAGNLVPYFAMELIEGRSLPECAGTLEIRGRLALVAQVCDAVHHAHQKGVIHRDLKPGNILVEAAPSTDSSSGAGTAAPFQIKILDFGIARATDSDMRAVTVQTDIGQLVGTLPYMSPEQAAGDPDALDTRSDVYSIGVIAFELLAGRLPHAVQGLPLHEAARIVHDAEPTRLGSIDRTLRGDVETIIAKALEKDRKHRYQSAAELGADIRRFLRDEPIVARPASALYHLGKFARRHRPLVVAAGLAFAAMAGATVLSAWQANVAVRAKTLAEAEQVRANRNADLAQQEARRATLAAAAAAIESGDPIDARRALDGIDESRRGWAWRYWHARLDDSVATVPVQGGIAGAWVSPDTSRLIAVSRDGWVASGSPWSGSLTQGPRLAVGPVAAAAFTADGARIICAGGSGARSLDVLDARDGRLIRHVADLPAPGVLVEASSDGATICVAVKSEAGAPAADDVWLWFADSPGRLMRNGRTSGISLTPDGRWLAAGFDCVTCWETSGASAPWLKPMDRESAVCAMTDDGTLIASGGEDKTVRIWDRKTAALLHSLRGQAGDITALAFDPVGRTLVSAGMDLAIHVWDVGTGKPVATLPGHTARIRSLKFAPDGAHFLSISDDGSIRLWQSNPYEQSCILRGHASYVYAVAFMRDGSRVVSGAWDQTVRIWNAASGRSLSVITDAGPGFITTLAVAQDGRTIATGHKTDEWATAQAFLWDADTGRQLDHFSFGHGESHDLVFNRAGTRLWAGWDYAGAGVADLGVHPVAMSPLVSHYSTHSLALSPDEGRLALGGPDGKVRLVDAATGVQLREWTAHVGAVRALAFCPNRPLLASASSDATIRVWNCDTGALVAKLDRHWGPVYCLAFSHDGATLASGSDDTTIRIWDIATGEELTRLRGHDAYIYSLAFSPDGSRLVSGSGDHTVRVWDTRPVHERWQSAYEQR